MDSEGRAGSSNSPSVDAVEVIDRRSHAGCTVRLHSGASFVIADKDVATLGLIAGGSVSEFDVERLRAFEAMRLIEAKSLDLLARRDHSVAELQTKLIQRKFDRSLVARVCAQLGQSGYLDDDRFARAWLSRRIRRRAEGALLLRAGLARTGVPREIVSRVLSEELSEEYEEEAFQRAVGELEGSGKRSASTIVRRLSALGFSSSRIQSYLEKSAN